MTELDKLAQSVRLASEIETESFVGTIKDIRLGKDRYGRSVLKIYVEYGDDTYVIALSPAYIRKAVEAFKRRGFKTTEELVGTTWEFVKTKLSVDGVYEAQPRFVPEARICTDDEIKALIGDTKVITQALVDVIISKCDNGVKWLSANCTPKPVKGGGQVWECK